MITSGISEGFESSKSSNIIELRPLLFFSKVSIKFQLSSNQFFCLLFWFRSRRKLPGERPSSDVLEKEEDEEEEGVSVFWEEPVLDDKNGTIRV